MAKEFARKFYNSTRWRKCAKAFAQSKLFICEMCHNQTSEKIDGNQRYIVHHKVPLTKCERKAPKFIYGDISSLKNNDSISLFFIVLYF